MLKLDSLKKKLHVNNFDSMVVLLLTFSIFLPFYASVAVVFGIAVMTMMNCKKRTKAFSSPYAKFILGFLIIPFFVSATYNNYWGMLYAIVILAVATSAFYVRSVMTQELFDKAMDLSAFLSVWCALIAIYQKIAVYSSAPKYRPISTFHNANCYGMMIEFIVIIAMYRIFTNPKFKNYYLAAIGINLVGLYLCASLSAFVATAVAVMTMFIMKNRYKLAIGLVAATAIFIAVGLVFPSIFPRGLEAIDNTLDQRLSIWSTSIKGILKNPFLGTGAMSYQMVCEQLGGYKTYHCHNLVLDTLLNYGFIGFGVMGIYIMTQMKLLYLRFKNNIGVNMDILFLAATMATAVHGLTDVTISWIQTGLLFILIFSSNGIGSEFLENQLRLPSLVPAYAGKSSVKTAYNEN